MASHVDIAASSPGRRIACLAAEGSASHPYAMAAAGDGLPIRDIADILHMLCLLHGQHPGVVDHACDATSPEARFALQPVVTAFAYERQRLAMLAAAAGPVPSTPGQAQSEAAAVGQRNALISLARSDRQGCAIGAAVALLLDWVAIRNMLDAAARRLTDVPPTSHFAAASTVSTWMTQLPETPAAARASVFGAEQLLMQQRGMWDLLHARKVARDTL